MTKLSCLRLTLRHDPHVTLSHIWRLAVPNAGKTLYDAVLTSTEPRIAPAELAVRGALDWYVEVVPRIKQPPVSLAQAEHLRAVLSGSQPRTDEDFELLVNFARSMYRVGQLDPNTPQINLGDVLTAVALLPQAGELPWTFDTRIDADAFAKLHFRETSLGLADTRRKNREGWKSHAQKNRAFIEAVAHQTQRRGSAVVLGAGHAFDLPLAQLAKTFDRLILIDIDGEALNTTVRGVLKDPGLRARTELRVLDLTGINGQFVRRIDEAVAEAENAGAARDRIEALCWNYRLLPPRLLAEEEPADLLVSSCVLSQVSWPHRVYARRVYERRFGSLRGPLELRWARHFTYLELRLQQDHLTSLVGVAEHVALTSDVVSNTTALDAAGVECRIGRPIPILGVPSLLERVPQLFRVERHASWLWGFAKVTRTENGLWKDVEGAHLTGGPP